VDAAILRDLAAPHYEEYVEALRQMVDVDSGSFTPAGVNRVADMCVVRFESGGWSVERRSPDPGSEPELGDMVIGTLRGSGGPRVLMIGHTDTVFDEGTVAERPFRVAGDRAYGPGVNDMKGGLLTGFFAIQVLREAGFDAFEQITYINNPDEEIGSPFSGPVIKELARGFDAAFVFEGARANGDIVSSRKGVTDYAITFHGRAAHSGVEPEKGRNALLEAAYKIIELQALNGRWPGVTVNVGVAQGGTRSNVVPDLCVLRVDLRSPEASTLEQAEAEIARICSTTVDPDVSIEASPRGWHRPMEKKEGGARLAQLAIEVAAELGFELRDASTGGASDANTTSAAGTPTIDGLGPVGGDDHAPAEWVDLNSIVPRIALFAGILSRL
jgi:glutamate carboxypeptidase